MLDKTGMVDRYKSDIKKPASVEPTYTRNTILVVSVDDDCKDELMDILTNNNFESKKIGELDDLLINFGKIKFDGYSQFNLVAISVDKQFAPFVTSLRQRITGTIFSFDCSQPETWEYTSYLIHSIWSKFQIPYIVAVMNFHEQNSITMDVIRYHLKLSEDIPMIEWDPVDKSSIRELLSLVTKTNLKEKPRKTSEMLDSLVEKVMM
jgi:signal recognition particle receptor subunit beta